MFDDAIVSFGKALELDPKDKHSLINLGNCLMSINDFDRSIKTYIKAIDLDPDCVMANYNLAAAYHSAATATTDPMLARQHFLKAREKFQATIKLKPDHADAFFNLGTVPQQNQQSLPSRCPVPRMFQESAFTMKEMFQMHEKCTERHWNSNQVLAAHCSSFFFKLKVTVLIFFQKMKKFGVRSVRWKSTIVDMPLF
jgi:tetratricopeptide (TPR) repeat protein